MRLTKGCYELLEMMNSTKPERESKGIQTWFKYEESIKYIITQLIFLLIFLNIRRQINYYLRKNTGKRRFTAHTISASRD